MDLRYLYAVSGYKDSYVSFVLLCYKLLNNTSIKI